MTFHRFGMRKPRLRIAEARQMMANLEKGSANDLPGFEILH
jgi:hypothetical protein